MTLTLIRGNFKNERFFLHFFVFFQKIWKNADFSTKSERDYLLMDLTFRDFGVNKQSDLSIAKLDISSNNIDFS